MRKGPVITESELWAAVDAVRAQSMPQSERPKGSFTVEEYAKRYKITPAAARAQLCRMVAGGIFERHRILGKASDDRNCVMCVYTVVKK